MFTQVCHSQLRPGIIDLVPAIAAFKNLKELSISCCPLLTDVCIVNGISFNQTLIRILLNGIRKQLTVASIQALNNAIFVQIVSSFNIIFNRNLFNCIYVYRVFDSSNVTSQVFILCNIL